MKNHIFRSVILLPFLLLPLVASSEAALTKEEMNEIRAIIKEELGHVNQRIDDLRTSLTKRIDDTNKRIDDTNSRIDDVRTSLIKQIDDTRVSLTRRIDDTRVSLTRQIDDTRVSLTRQIDDVRISLTKQVDDSNKRIDDTNKRLDDLYTLMLWGFGITFTGIFGLIGFVIWDRRTAIKPVQRDVKEAEDKIYKLEKVLKEYSHKEPELATILRNIGML